MHGSSGRHVRAGGKAESQRYRIFRARFIARSARRLKRELPIPPDIGYFINEKMQTVPISRTRGRSCIHVRILETTVAIHSAVKPRTQHVAKDDQDGGTSRTFADS